MLPSALRSRVLLSRGRSIAIRVSRVPVNRTGSLAAQRRLCTSTSKPPLPAVHVITKEIDETRRDDYNQWQADGQSLLDEVLGEGFATMHVTKADSAAEGGAKHDTIVVTFRTRELHDRWRESKALEHWRASGEEFQKRLSSTVVEVPSTTLHGWMPPSDGSGPALWKTGTVVLFAMYPISTFSKLVVVPGVLSAAPALLLAPPCIQSFVFCAINVAIMSTMVLPVTRHALGFFLAPSSVPMTVLHSSGVAGCMGLVVFGCGLVSGEFPNVWVPH